MSFIKTNLPESPRPFVRLLILLAGIATLMGINYYFNKTLIPADPKATLIFQGGLLFIVLGSLFLEDKFTKPVDALMNSLAGFVSLLTVQDLNPPHWNLLAMYCVGVFCLSAGCISLGIPQDNASKFPTLSRVLYRLSTFFGKSNVIYSLIFLYALLVFYSIQSPITIVLVIFWGMYLALWPLKIPHLLQSIFEIRKTPVNEIGMICRSESPDLIRVKLAKGAKWDGENNLIACLPGSEYRHVYPIYSQLQEEGVVGTGLLLSRTDAKIENATLSGVYASDEAVLARQGADIVREYYRLNDNMRPIGLVVEGSSIGKIKFEIWNSSSCKEGMLVFCKIGDEYVYYQIIEGTTHEETLEKDRHGFQIAHAIQLGVLHKSGAFKKYQWVPSMNVPVFQAVNIKKPVDSKPGNIFEIGTMPESTIKIFADLKKMRYYHTAILGVTGTGKTEFAFDIIRLNIAQKVKVFCVDLTAIYENELTDVNPVELSISDEISDGLSQKILEAETGEYGGGKEKKVLKEYADKIRADIKKKVEDFLKDDKKYLGIFKLPTISNTKATVYATEIYLSTILGYARHTKDAPDILIVLEEAHTVIPESRTMGLGDYESQGMVAKISQIALQGRKYRVGLLIIAQRTANVSKTVLSQCNTIFAFSTFDETGISYMANVFGKDIADSLPNLGFLQAVAYGKGILSDRPLIFSIPYDEKKDDENKPSPSKEAIPQ